jgi:hypothetical protein
MRTLFTFLFITFCSSVIAQQVIATAGSTFSNNSGSLSYTIGEGIAQTLSKGDKTLTQGFHQTTISVSILSEQKDLELSISVFPNPTIDNLTLNIKVGSDARIQYVASFYDINGKILLNKEFEGSQTIISMENLIPGIYFLKVCTNNKELKIFKIVKK